MDLYETARVQNASLLGKVTELELHPPGEADLLLELQDEFEALSHLRTQHLYPLCSEYPEVRGLAARCERERRKVEEDLERISTAPPSDTSRDLGVASLREHVRQLVELEEGELIPAAREAIPDDTAEMVATHHAAEPRPARHRH